MIVSLTTISSRLEKIASVIENILEQDFSDFHVVLYVSKEPWLLDEGVVSLPHNLKALQKMGGFEVKWTKNIGPYRKLIPALKENWGKDVKIVTIDDDVVYPNDFLKTLSLASEIYECPVAYRGREINTNPVGDILPYRSWLGSSLAGASGMKVPTGKDGVIYRTSHFSKTVFDQEKAVKLAKTADDLWFKWNTVKNGFASCLLFDNLKESFEVLDGEDEVNLYSHYNRDGKNDDVVSNLESWFSIKNILSRGGLRC